MKNIIEATVLFGKLFKTNMQIILGMVKISKLPQPRVTIFGGHLLQNDTIFSSMAHDLAYRLVQDNISVITGGGPGVMQAANCGASHIKKGMKKTIRSIGITVKDLEPVDFNYCAQERLIVDYFYARKWLMLNYSHAFVIFPGGFGTLDELCEALMLMQTKKLEKHAVILVGKEYWSNITTWMMKTALQQKLILKDDLAFLTITDDMEEVYQVLKKHSAQYKKV